MRRIPILAAAAFFLGLFCFTALRAAEQVYCPLCSMNLKMFWNTHHSLTFADGTRSGYCSLHCAAQVYQEKAAAIDHWQVTDFHTKALIDARRAHFLIGSKLPGTMTAVSKLAFGSPEECRRYQTEHGGTIGTLDDALRKTLEGLGEDMALIRQKVAMRSAKGRETAGRHGCYGCHGEDGAGGRAVGWQSPEFARRMDSRVKIKDSILSGTHGMEGYRDRLSEDELHSIAVYIWSRRAQ